jgi:hypothetical protein
LKIDFLPTVEKEFKKVFNLWVWKC